MGLVCQYKVSASGVTPSKQVCSLIKLSKPQTSQKSCNFKPSGVILNHVVIKYYYRLYEDQYVDWTIFLKTLSKWQKDVN